MSKLSDTQLILLSRAAAHDDGFASRPDGMAKAGAVKAAASLIARKLMREIKAKPGMPVWREGDEGRPVSLAITAAGRKAVGVVDDRSAFNQLQAEQDRSAKKGGVAAEPKKMADAAPTAAEGRVGAVPRTGSKQALVVELLSAEAGTTLDALVDATGWLPHTTRAALTGLRKRGVAISRERQSGKVSVYRIAAATLAQASA